MMVIFILVFASLSEYLGLHFIVGAFFGTILIPRSIFTRKDYSGLKQTTSTITMGFLAPIFFAYMGISFQMKAITNFPLLFTIILVAFVSKFTGGYLGGRLAGIERAKAVAIGIGLNARGIMELVIASIALQQGFIDIAVFSILVVMALVTTLVTPVMLQAWFRWKNP
jgi:Kef-type K+ transport system membrane component KefB